MSSIETDPRVGAHRRWVSDGMLVWAPIGVKDNKRIFALCTVLNAAGIDALVGSEKHRFQGWMRVEELFTYIPPDAVAILQDKA
jgi:hypothetical protein